MSSKKSKKAKATVRKAKAVRSAEAAPAPTVKRKGVKLQIADILMAGANLTVEELMKATNAKTVVTVKTALSDLKSGTYCGLSTPLAIVSNEGRYRLLTDFELEQMGGAMDSHNRAAKEAKQ